MYEFASSWLIPGLYVNIQEHAYIRSSMLHMPAQANPYTIATDSFGDVLRKYKHAWSNTDDVPAKWEDIPNDMQKHKVESLGEWLTNVSGYVGLVRWAKSRSITLKGNHESVEHWWNRLRRASQIEVWHFANYTMA